MEVQVEVPGGLRRAMRVKVPADRVAQAVDQRLRRMAQRAKVPGFRPGKAPFKVIAQQYGESARLDAVADLVNQTYPEALSQAGVSPAGQPKIDVTAEKPGEPLEYTAHFEVYPEIQLADLTALKIEKPRVEVTDADVERLIENLRRARRNFVETRRAAQSGDNVTVDFLGKLDGEAFAGGEGKDVKFEIGASQFLPDLEQGIIGHAAGEQFSVDVKFPDDYRAENLRGKTAVFEINLKQVMGAELPEIDDAFLAAHNVPAAEGLEGLRSKCRSALEKERDKAVQARVKTQALEQLLTHNPVDVPQALVEQELPRLREEAVSRMGLNRGSQIKPEQLQQMLPAELFEPQARRRVALGLLIGEVIKARAIRLDEARLEAMLSQIAGDYEHPEQVRQFYRSRPDLLQGLRAMVLEDQVVDSLVAGVQVSEVSQTLDELLKSQQQAQA
ncbi:MAG: trigger factor [Gammaproteobacteria bacterium]